MPIPGVFESGPPPRPAAVRPPPLLWQWPRVRARSPRHRDLRTESTQPIVTRDRRW